MKRLTKQDGFTLLELMIAVIILSIITAIALPGFNDSAQKGRRSDGQGTLLDAASKLEAYFYSNKTYTLDMTQLGYSADPAPSPEGYYTIDVSAATSACPITTCFELEATALAAQVSDGNLTFDSAGRKLPADKW